MGDTKSRTASDFPRVESPTTSIASQIRPRGPVLFGKYELLSRLRVGGMAELFRARELNQSARVVAVKRILASFTDEADYIAMFLDEARLGLQLKHPGIVETFELGQVEDELYIALEYVHGQDVGALLRRARELKQPLPVGVACAIVLAVCEALEYAHELRDERGGMLGIVHRDVSPQNVLVSYDGDVKLIDFGIAKSSEQLMRTQAGLLKGKHGYLSPEQAQGQAVDRRSDLFSLGVCFYEMLSAERLFLGSSDFSTIVRVRKTDVPSLQAHNSAVPEPLAAIVHRALARQASERFATAAEMASALRAFIAPSGEPCDRAELAAYVRSSFPQGLLGANLEPSVDGERDAGTGLLDAFDGVEPPSAVSVLSAFETPAPAPAAGTPGSALLQAVSAALLEKVDELDRAAHDLGSEPPDQARPELGARRGAPGRWPADESEEPADPRHDEPTRVVEYESTLNGEVADEPTHVSRQPERTARAQSTEENDSDVGTPPNETTRPRGRRPQAPRADVPGSSMEWDEEELSTHIYDSAASTDDVRAPAASSFSPSRAPSSASAPPLGGSPEIGAPSPFVSARPAPISMPTVRRSMPSRAPQIDFVRGLARSVLLFRAAVAIAVVALVAAAFWLIREPARATLQLTTDPPDAMVTLDGLVVGGSASPFVLTGIRPDVSHEIEVREQGYRSWHTRLILRPGQKVDLPHVVLQKETTQRLWTAPHPVEAPPRQAPQTAPPPSAALAPQTPPPQSQTKLAAATGIGSTLGPRTSQRSTAAPRPRLALSKRPAARAAEAGGTGTLRINSRPWGRIYVDGRLVGNTPQTGIVLSAGRHTVTLVNPQFNLRKVLTIQLKPGESVTRVVALSE